MRWSVRLGRRCLSRQASSSSSQLRPPPPKIATRPELDFDYLLDPANTDAIAANIAARKHIGDIQAVHALWGRLSRHLEGTEPINNREALATAWDEFYAAAMAIPNRSSPDTLVGDEGEEMAVYGEKPPPTNRSSPGETFGGKHNGYESLTLTAGSRGYFLQGSFIRLEEALLDFVLDRVRRRFRLIGVPDLLPHSVPTACGLAARQDLIFRPAQAPQLCLSGTGEMGIAAQLAGRVFEEAELSDGLRLAAVSRCFRPEVPRGAASHGLYRVHEFTKVELFALTRADEAESQALLKELVDFQVELYNELGLHFRVLRMGSGELGASAWEKWDCEAWLAGRNFFGEISSASNCADFQSRRLPIRYRTASGELRYPHTLNATAAASTRLLLAAIETHMKPSRTGNLNKLFLDVPEPLKPYLSKVKSPRSSYRFVQARHSSNPGHYARIARGLEEPKSAADET